jgi:hypothetical protein
MKLLTQVWNYLPRYEITCPGMKLLAQVWNYLPRFEITYPDLKFYTQCTNCEQSSFIPGAQFITRYDISYPGLKLTFDTDLLPTVWKNVLNCARVSIIFWLKTIIRIRNNLCKLIRKILPKRRNFAQPSKHTTIFSNLQYICNILSQTCVKILQICEKLMLANCSKTSILKKLDSKCR